MLNVSNLQKTFGGLSALRGISMTVPARSIIGILGMNGSGKTTLLNCINGLYTASDGEITLDGENLVGLSPNQVFTRGIGRTFQVPRIFPKMTLMENLAAPLLNAGMSNQEIEDAGRVWLERVDLWRLRHNYGSELSGGQQKLLELARVMVARPRLVLLDEPFAGVNPSLALLLIDLIRQMPERDGCSVLLVSHDLTSVYQLSDHIVVMHEGSILAEGDAEAVQNNPDVVEAYLGA